MSKTERLDSIHALEREAQVLTITLDFDGGMVTLHPMAGESAVFDWTHDGGIEATQHWLQEKKAVYYGPFVKGDYHLGQQIHASYTTGRVIWSYRAPLRGLTYVVDDGTSWPTEILAQEVEAHAEKSNGQAGGPLRTSLVVGVVSETAQEELEAAQATIQQIHHDPPLFLITVLHQAWYRTHDGSDYPDLELEDGRFIIRSQDLELTYDRKPYDISQTTIKSIYES